MYIGFFTHVKQSAGYCPEGAPEALWLALRTSKTDDYINTCKVIKKTNVRVEDERCDDDICFMSVNGAYRGISTGSTMTC